MASRQRYEITSSLTKRAASAFLESGRVDWESAVDFLRSENTYKPERQIEYLIRKLDELGYVNMAIQLGASAAYRAQSAREDIATIRRAFRYFMDTDCVNALDSKDDNQ